MTLGSRIFMSRRKQAAAAHQGGAAHAISHNFHRNWDDNNGVVMEREILLNGSHGGIRTHPSPLLMLHYSDHSVLGHHEHDGGYGNRHSVRSKRH